MKFRVFDCFVKGGAMGIGPNEVRELSLSDLAAAFQGWQMSQGIEPPLNESDVERLDSLMARYPDKVK